VVDRKQFVKTCGFACLSASALSLLLQSCTTPRIITADISGSDLVVPLSNFEAMKNSVKQFKKYLVVHNDLLQYPICVFRLDENDYSALLMRCTHQGTELQVFGNRLQCPAHGSEFDNKGKVQHPPAQADLRSFPVIIEDDQLRISLK